MPVIEFTTARKLIGIPFPCMHRYRQRLSLIAHRAADGRRRPMAPAPPRPKPNRQVCSRHQWHWLATAGWFANFPLREWSRHLTTGRSTARLATSVFKLKKIFRRFPMSNGTRALKARSPMIHAAVNSRVTFSCSLKNRCH